MIGLISADETFTGLYYMIDWLVFNANFSNISAISWREQITYKALRNKT